VREERVLAPGTMDRLARLASAVSDNLWERYAAAEGAPYLTAEEEWEVLDLLIALLSSVGTLSEAFFRGPDEGLVTLYRLIERELWEEDRTVPLRRRTVPAHLRRFVLQRDGYACSDCGSTQRLHIDHIVPVSKGGPNHAANLRTLCQRCNLSKAATL